MVAIGEGPELGDAFGRALSDMHAGRPGVIVVERDDGLVEADVGDYLSGWDDGDTWVLARAPGRVLDLGAGAGRASVVLQERGQDVVALDVSPGAIDVCRRRGVKQVFLGTVAELAATRPAPFDSVLMLGNNLGLLGSPQHAPDVLAALDTVLRPGAVIAGACIDPYQTGNPVHLDYHQRNRRAGRMPGQVTIRIRYQRLATQWFDLLWMSLTELDQIAASAGWRVTAALPGAEYRAVLTRT
jgi:SAM-dependent methyltransferase